MIKSTDFLVVDIEEINRCGCNGDDIQKLIRKKIECIKEG